MTLSRLTLLITLLMIVVSTAFATVRQPDRVLAFNPPGCELPCVIGVVPDITTASEAEKILSQRTIRNPNANLVSEMLIVGDKPNQAFIWVDLHYPNLPGPRYVSQVGISARDEIPLTTLGQMLNAGYKVHKVFRSNYAMLHADHGIFLLTFAPENQIVASVLVTQSMDSSTKITDIYVLSTKNNDYNLRQIKAKWHSEDEIRWLGFAPIQSYFDEPTINGK
jgi:hypothetical protein